jgi:hypothetical protein
VILIGLKQDSFRAAQNVGVRSKKVSGYFISLPSDKYFARRCFVGRKKQQLSRNTLRTRAFIVEATKMNTKYRLVGTFNQDIHDLFNLNSDIQGSRGAQAIRDYLIFKFGSEAMHRVYVVPPSFEGTALEWERINGL